MWFASTFPESVLAVSTTLLDPFGGGGGFSTPESTFCMASLHLPSPNIYFLPRNSMLFSGPSPSHTVHTQVPAVWP